VKRSLFLSAALSESKLTFYSLIGTYLKDAIDLLQGHYIVSVSRDMTPSSPKGGLETVAVSTSQMAISFVHIIFRQLIISVCIMYISVCDIFLSSFCGRYFPVVFSTKIIFT
jgi:hypothetical protein